MLKPIIDFDYGNISIYMILVGTGFLFAYIAFVVAQSRIKCPLAVKRKVKTSFLIAFPIGIVCANIFNWFLFPEVLQYPLTKRMELGGFSFYYGMLSFIGVSALLLKLKGIDYKYWINEIIPPLLIFHAFGRIGCSLSGCCYGIDVTVFGYTFGFPAREIEAVFLFVMYFIFQKKVKEHRFFWYLICYSTMRFLLEFGRGDDRGFLFLSGISPAQVTSILIWCILIIIMNIKKIKLKSKRKRC